jgi:hypothetical protein
MVMDRQQQQGKAAAFDVAEAGFGDRPDLDDDGRERRTGIYIYIMHAKLYHVSNTCGPWLHGGGVACCVPF